jgi:hypothetical protein
MTHKPYSYSSPASRPAINLGPRLRAEIEREIRQLAGRFQPSGHDLRELARLRALLNSGGQRHG